MAKGRFINEYDYEGISNSALDFISDIVEEIVARQLNNDDIHGRTVGTEDTKPLAHININIDIY